MPGDDSTSASDSTPMPPDDLVERLDAYAVPLERPTPETSPSGNEALAESDSLPESDSLTESDSLANLDAVANVFEGKRVFGLGEATHGTKEFFELKRRLVELLVTELDVRLFGLEANFSETLAIDRYVVTGEGDPEEALAGIYFWTWNTEEMLALVEWLREYNDDRQLDEKVRFYGFDAKFTQGPARAIGDFFQRVDPDYLDEIGDLLARVAERPPGDDPDATTDWLVAAETLTETLANRFETREAAYRDEVTDREWRLVGRHRRVIEQAADLVAARTFTDSGDPNGVRDAAMAENVAWLLDHEDADRIAVWAHNGHVRRGTFQGEDWERPPKTMGQHLTETFGDDYHALGFEFGRGSFQARPDPETTDDSGVRTFSLGPPPDNSLPAVLAELDHSCYHLDVAAAAEDTGSGKDEGPRDDGRAREGERSDAGDETLRDWLTSERRLHNVGSVCYEDADSAYVPVELGSEFDGIVFVAETSRAVPIRGT
jgi:erythromycin esterase